MTVTARSPELPKLIVELQEIPDPATGEFPSYQAIADRLAAEHGIEMTRAGVRQSAIRYRTANGLAPAPRKKSRLPWELPDEIHQNDLTAYCCHRIARVELARQNGAETQLTRSEQSAVDSFYRLLSRMGPATVVVWDAEASQGKGGWLLRQAKEGEEVWYGVMAVRP